MLNKPLVSVCVFCLVFTLSSCQNIKTSSVSKDKHWNALNSESKKITDSQVEIVSPVIQIKVDYYHDFYKELMEENSNSVVYPIQINDGKLEYIVNRSLFRLDLTNYKAALEKDSLQGFSMRTDHPPEWPGSWMISSNDAYYFPNTTGTEKNLFFTLDCVDQKTIKTRWSSKLCPSTYYGNSSKMLEHQDSIVIISLRNFHIYSVNKNDGSIEWDKAICPDILNELTIQPNNGCREEILYPKQVNEKGVVFRFSSQCYSMNNGAADLKIAESFFLSWDGKYSNVLSAEPISFYQDTYFYRNADDLVCASQIDNHILWKKHFSVFSSFSHEAHFFCTDTNKLLVGEKSTGKIIDQQEITQPYKGSTITKVNETYYLCGSDSSYPPNDAFLLIWTPGQKIQELKIEPANPERTYVGDIVDAFAIKN